MIKVEILNEEGKWVAGNPVDGQRLRHVLNGDVVSEAIHYVKPEEDEAREWRDSELAATDFIVPTTDHPQHAAYLAYRQALRDWPNTPEFPDTRPTLGG